MESISMRNAEKSKLVLELNSISVDIKDSNGRDINATIHGLKRSLEILEACDNMGYFKTLGLKGKVNTIHYFTRESIINETNEGVFLLFGSYLSLGRPTEIEQIISYRKNK